MKRKNTNAAEKPKNKSKKNISLPAPVQKVVDAIAQPIKDIVHKRHKKVEVDVPFAENQVTSNTTSSMQFFYSNDRFIDTFDDVHLYEQICKDYPALLQSSTNMQHKRNSIIELLSNEEYMQELMTSYQLSVFDVVSFIFRICPSLFKGIFIKKVQNTIRSKKYAKDIKSHRYKIAKSRKAVSCRRRARKTQH